MAAGARATTAGISLVCLALTYVRLRVRSGGLVGGQIGYRWQANQWVFGVEAQGDGRSQPPRSTSVDPASLSTRTTTDGIGLFTGQIGYAWN